MRRISRLVITAVLVTSTGTAAQQPWTLDGRVLDASGRPVDGQAVLLHRVTGGGGASIAADTTDAQGRFSLRPDATPSADAVVFAAARYQDEVYVGSMIRAPFEDISDYLLQVGVPANSVSALFNAPPVAAQPSPGGATGSPLRWGLALIPALGLAGVALYMMARRRTPERRRVLLAIARLDEEAAQDEPENYRTERDRLLDRLRAAEQP